MNFVDWSISALKEWQTLAAGFVALVAAGLTVWRMGHQIGVQKDQFEERRRRRLIACKAMLPADLSALMEYAKESAHVSGTAILMIRNAHPRRTLACPELPERVFQNLQNLVENVEKESDAEEISAMLRCYQTQRAFLTSEIGAFNEPNRLGRHRIMTEHNIESTVAGTVELYLLIENMFKFAREEEASIPVPAFVEEDVANAMRCLEIEDVLSRDCATHLIDALSNNKN